MNKKEKNFIVFCIEMYKVKKRKTGKEIYNLFNEYKVIDYLNNGYEMLHTQGSEWLINDIDEFLKIRGYTIK